MTTGRLTVLQSFGTPSPTSNPYLGLLDDALAPYADVQHFSWRRALGGGYDVLHLHWPERLVRGRTGPTTAARLVLLLLVLGTTRLRRQAVVRTLHNVHPHEPGSRAERLLLRLCDRRTALYVLLTPAVTPPTPAARVVIPHGHYRDRFAAVPAVVDDPQPGRLLTFGLLRRYKGLDALLEAFAGTPEQITLHVAGRVEDDDTAALVRAAQARDSRVSAHLEFVPDALLAEEIVRSTCVVLPYRTLVNSGAALLALSLDRPVLVPDNAITRALAEEVGTQWVRRFTAPLTAADLTAATAAAPPEHDGHVGRPDLHRREWPAAGAAHAAAYARAVRLTRRR